MRIVIFGATGPTGRRLTEQALEAGHRVTAVTRRPGILLQAEGLTVACADVNDRAAVESAVEGSDAVLSALGVPPGRKPVTVYSVGTGNIIEAMRRQAVKRLVVVSSSVIDPHWRPSGARFFNHVLDPYVNRVIARTAHDDMRRMEALVRASGLKWTIARASGLFDHPTITDYRVSENSGDGVYTARSDLASGMVRQLGSDRYVGKAMGVVTTEAKPGIAKLIWREAITKKQLQSQR
ncbi:NAD(P)-dependent oxidoreductase [Streptomyces sp. NBC_00344]|uniref:NAD(P)-dependent oxidoreductase n=1 Tax=Streptomyces sp. NBC_00344 TaxID=2975720 RepID=UPI002E21828B